MKSNINISPLPVYFELPLVWNNTYNYRNATTHYADGWRDVINPSFNTATEKLGDLIISGDTITYQVVPLSEAEIKERLISASKLQKSTFINTKLQNQIEAELQTIVTDEEILENQQGYPLWADFPLGHSFGLGFKLQDFDGLELKVFKVIQEHNKQADWNPNAVPALWSKIELSNGVEVWTQPTGGDGKYVFGAIVTHNGSTWQNTHPAPSLNVWEPGVFGWVII